MDSILKEALNIALLDADESAKHFAQQANRLGAALAAGSDSKLHLEKQKDFALRAVRRAAHAEVLKKIIPDDHG